MAANRIRAHATRKGGCMRYGPRMAGAGSQAVQKGVYNTRRRVRYGKRARRNGWGGAGSAGPGGRGWGAFQGAPAALPAMTDAIYIYRITEPYGSRTARLGEPKIAWLEPALRKNIRGASRGTARQIQHPGGGGQ